MKEPFHGIFMDDKIPNVPQIIFTLAHSKYDEAFTMR